MRRSPFYAYPHLPYSFYTPPAEAAFHRPRRAFPPPSPATPPSPPTPGSVINVPVFDSAPSRPNSSSSPPPQPNDSRPPSSPPPFSARPVIDPSSAAVAIQSCFRGFCVRRHHPLLHLRSIANARRELEDLQSELESPGFSLKVRASEKERLRFSESIMAIILRLDAIEGSIAEVRRQRKEATKKAIKLQDALDAIMMQKVETADPQPTDGPFPFRSAATDAGDALYEQSEECPCSDLDMVRGGGDGHDVAKESATDFNTVEEQCASPEIVVADKRAPNLDKDNIIEVVDNNISSGEHKPGTFELVPRVMAVESMNEAGQEISGITGENVTSVITGENGGAHAAEELNNAIDPLCLDASKNDKQSNALVAKVEGTVVDDMLIAGHGSVKMGSNSDGSYTCLNAIQEVEESTSRGIEVCPDTSAAEAKRDYVPHSSTAHEIQVQCLSTAFNRQPEDNCSSDIMDCPTLASHVHETQNNVAEGSCNDKGNSCNEVKIHICSSEVGTPLVSDTKLLHQLAEDSKQLKVLVGKLLAQNKAQSKVLCALAERLELLEHQQQLGCQHKHPNMHKKRKSKKGAKRSARYYDCE